MNQGNVERFRKDDGVWQDGAQCALRCNSRTKAALSHFWMSAE